ncbi:hypothetical protein CIB48_g802 [Xylaria polymorpha]|nr:hypothetical protein CIB48_g802 [Xylaria polymorpha]
MSFDLGTDGQMDVWMEEDHPGGTRRAAGEGESETGLTDGGTSTGSAVVQLALGHKLLECKCAAHVSASVSTGRQATGDRRQGPKYATVSVWGIPSGKHHVAQSGRDSPWSAGWSQKISNISRAPLLGNKNYGQSRSLVREPDTQNPAWGMSGEMGATVGGGRWAVGNEQWATGNGQRATGSGRRGWLLEMTTPAASHDHLNNSNTALQFMPGPAPYPLGYDHRTTVPQAVKENDALKSPGMRNVSTVDGGCLFARDQSYP